LSERGCVRSASRGLPEQSQSVLWFCALRLVCDTAALLAKRMAVAGRCVRQTTLLFLILVTFCAIRSVYFVHGDHSGKALRTENKDGHWLIYPDTTTPLKPFTVIVLAVACDVSPVQPCTI